MPVLMLMLITLLNDGTLIAIGYDNVNPRKCPESWNLQLLFLVGAVLQLLHWCPHYCCYIFVWTVGAMDLCFKRSESVDCRMVKSQQLST